LHCVVVDQFVGRRQQHNSQTTSSVLYCPTDLRLTTVNIKHPTVHYDICVDSSTHQCVIKTSLKKCPTMNGKVNRHCVL